MRSGSRDVMPGARVGKFGLERTSASRQQSVGGEGYNTRPFVCDIF